jgi:hypothetical protein
VRKPMLFPTAGEAGFRNQSVTVPPLTERAPLVGDCQASESVVLAKNVFYLNTAFRLASAAEFQP